MPLQGFIFPPYSSEKKLELEPEALPHLAAMGRDDAQVSWHPVATLDLHQVPDHHLLLPSPSPFSSLSSSSKFPVNKNLFTAMGKVANKGDFREDETNYKIYQLIYDLIDISI